MSSYSDFKVEQESASRANSEMMVRPVDNVGSFGAAQVDNAGSFGLDRAVASDFSGATNAARFFSGGARGIADAARTLASVDEGGRRAPAIADAVGDNVRATAAQWLKERPEAVWAFLKKKTRDAWEPSEDQDAATSEIFGEAGTAKDELFRAPGRLNGIRKNLEHRASQRLSRWDGKAALHQRKAVKLSAKSGIPLSVSDAEVPIGAVPKARAKPASAGSAGAGSAIMRLRIRHHERKAERLRGEGRGVLGLVMKSRRGKNSFVQTVTSNRFLAGAAASLALTVLLGGFLVIGAPAALASVVAAMGAGQQSASVNLNDVEARIATFFRLKGLDDLHIAAIMGNMAWESGGETGTIRPDAEEGGNQGMGIGISQWSRSRQKGGGWAPGRRGALIEFAASQGKPWQDLNVQLEFFWGHDEWGNGWGSGGMTESAFLSCTDLDTATEIFCFGWERPARVSAHLVTRQAHARNFLTALQSSGGGAGGQEYADASDAQRRVADFATAGSLYGNTGGWCQAWVADVYQLATGVWDSRCCANMAGDCWAVSMSKQGIPVGATVYGSRSAGHVICSNCGQDAAHVAIYVGGGMVVSNKGGYAPVTEPLDSFIKVYGWSGWGWNGGRNLAAS